MGAHLPFYIRKSVAAGPFRFNFSKGGVGVSVGIKGLRIGTGPRGHYIHAGRGGLYYRATLSNAGRTRSSSSGINEQPSPHLTFDNGDVTMIEIESGDVMAMRDESFGEVLDEINSKTRQTRMSSLFAWIAIMIGGVAGLASGGPGLLLCGMGLPAWAIGKWFDSYRRTTVLYYDLEGDAETAYTRLAQAFDGLNGCAAKWHIKAGGAVQSLTAWKRNAGASHIVDRKATTLAYSLPDVIRSNVTPPALHVGKQVMFFMPDIVLIQDGSRIGSVNYTDLNIRWQDSRFIETERVPSDARVVDHTWKHPNKSGGPDRRFKDNRQIPICLYEAMHLTSSSGVNELVEFSKTGVTSAFVDGCRMLAALPRGRTAGLPTPAANATEPVPVAEPAKKLGVFKVALVTIMSFLVVTTVLAMIGRSGTGKTETAFQPALVSNTSASPPAQNVSANISVKPNAVQSSQSTSAVVGTTPTSVAIDAGQTAPNDQPEPKQTVRYTKTSVNLREGPGTRFGVIAIVPSGAAVSISEVKGAWVMVVTEGKKSGWMASSTISEQRGAP